MGSTGQVRAGQDQRRPVYDSYARLSRVPETGELEKIDTQHADNRKVIERLGSVLGEELDDGRPKITKSVRPRTRSSSVPRRGAEVVTAWQANAQDTG